MYLDSRLAPTAELYPDSHKLGEEKHTWSQVWGCTLLNPLSRKIEKSAHGLAA